MSQYLELLQYWYFLDVVPFHIKFNKKKITRNSKVFLKSRIVVGNNSTELKFCENLSQLAVSWKQCQIRTDSGIRSNTLDLLLRQ